MTTLNQRHSLMPLLLVLILLVWVTLCVWGQSPYGRFLTFGRHLWLVTLALWAVAATPT